jgi:hypothetical protein
MVCYTYVIVFEDSFFYIGVRKCPKNLTPFTDLYSGSPVTHKEKWVNTTFKKKVISIHGTWKEASFKEIELLNHVKWNSNPRCLNENNGGCFSEETCSKAGKIGGKTTIDKMRNDPDFAKARNKKLSESLKRRYRENPEVLEKQRVLVLEASMKSLKSRESLLRNNPDYYKNNGLKISEALKLKASEDPSFREQLAIKANKASETYRKMLKEDPEFREKVKAGRERAALKIKNSVWITNGQKDRRVSADLPIPDGFRRGRSNNKRRSEQ